jgi:hypothetical protein
MGASIVLFSRIPPSRKRERRKKGVRPPDYTVEVLGYELEEHLTDFLLHSRIVNRLPTLSAWKPFGSDTWLHSDDMRQVVSEIDQAVADPETREAWKDALIETRRLALRCLKEQLVLAVIAD